MTVYMTANSWWTSFSNCDMVVSNFDDCPFCFLFYILVIRVSALVLIDGGVLDFCVRDLVLCAGAVVFIIGLCLFFMFLFWLSLTVPPPELLVWILLLIFERVVSLILFGMCCYC